MASEPATVWTGSNGEFTAGSGLDIADVSGKLLVDASSNNIVDSGITFTPNPATVWASNDGNA